MAKIHSLQPSKLDRYQRVIALYTTTNVTLQEIADEFGITREAVRQICKRLLGKGHKGYRPPEVLPTPDEIIAMVKENGCTRALRNRRYRLIWNGIPADRRREVMLEISISTAPQRSKSLCRYTKADCIKALKHAAKTLGRTFTKRQYDLYARAHSYVSGAEIAIQFGRWNLARRAAGLPEIKPQRDNYQRMGVDVCLQAVAAVHDLLGQPPTTAQYTKLRKETAPCLSTVINRYYDSSENRSLGWGSIVELAQKYRTVKP